MKRKCIFILSFCLVGLLTSCQAVSPSGTITTSAPIETGTPSINPTTGTIPTTGTSLDTTSVTSQNPLVENFTPTELFKVIKKVSTEANYRLDYYQKNSGGEIFDVFNEKYSYSSATNQGVVLSDNYLDRSKKAGYDYAVNKDGTVSVRFLADNSGDTYTSISQLSKLSSIPYDEGEEGAVSEKDLVTSEDPSVIFSNNTSLIDAFSQAIGQDSFLFDEIDFSLDANSNLSFTLVVSAEMSGEVDDIPKEERTGILSLVGEAKVPGIDASLASYEIPKESASKDALKLLSSEKGEVNLIVRDHYDGKDPEVIGGTTLLYNSDAYESLQNGLEGSVYYHNVNGKSSQQYITYQNKVEEKNTDVTWKDFTSELTKNVLDSGAILKVNDSTYQLFSNTGSDLFYGYSLSTLYSDVKQVLLHTDKSGVITNFDIISMDQVDTTTKEEYYTEGHFELKSTPQDPKPLTPFKNSADVNKKIEKAFSKVRSSNFKVDISDSGKLQSGYSFYSSKDIFLKYYSSKASSDEDDSLAKEVADGYYLKDGKATRFHAYGDKSVVNLSEKPTEATNIQSVSPLFDSKLSFDVLTVKDNKILVKFNVENILGHLIPHYMAEFAQSYSINLDKEGYLSDITFSYSDDFEQIGTVTEKITYLTGEKTGLDKDLEKNIRSMPAFTKPTKWSKDTPTLLRDATSKVLTGLAGKEMTVDDLPYVYFPKMQTAWGAFYSDGSFLEFYVWNHPSEFETISQDDIKAFVTAYQKELLAKGYVLDEKASSDTSKVYKKDGLQIRVRLDDWTLSSIVKVEKAAPEANA